MTSPDSPSASAPPPALPPAPPPALWLALHFPRLPIDRLAAGGLQEDVGQAVIIQEGATRRILSCNDVAREAGVRAGLALSTAWSLVPDLVITEFDEAVQAAHLQQLTLLALSWSSRVTPKPPDSILLEIGASLTLFGGLKALLATVHDALQLQGVSVNSATAPTPAAALLFAQTSTGVIVRELSALDASLAPIPLTRNMLGDAICTGLHRSGVRNLGALRKLPVKPLARRFGASLTDWLYKLDGRLPDPQSPWQAPETFEQGLDLPLEAPDTAALAFPLKRLVAALGGFLVARDLGVCRMDIQLHHHRRVPSGIPLLFTDATANSDHLLKVARERLATTELPAPVIRVVLLATELAPVERAASDLLDRGRARDGGIEQVLDRLRARLGSEALYTAHTGDDHRPEKAWLAALLEHPDAGDAWPARPLWLYREPLPAPTSLTLLTPPERIENGWWGDSDVRRDYYIAQDTHGSHLWVYRSRRDPARVWVHGVFA